MKNFLVIAILFVLPPVLRSQNFEGKVTGTSGEPISGATVYIKENKQGLVCNTNGEFQVTLPEGDYNCTFSCLGYAATERSFSIKKEADPVYMEITLKTTSFELSEVVVRAGEDPAYEMIRKAVKKAPLYLAQIKEFTCEAYIKGAGKSVHIPGWIEKMGGEQLKLYKDKLFLQESFSEVKYTYPDKYVQNVIAFSSSMPNDSIAKDAMGIFRGSLYAQYDGSILHPKTFSYYRFRYEDFEEIDGVNVNKIKIIPRFNDPKLFSGYLYLAEDYWNIRGAELILNTEFGKVKYTLNYNDVTDHIFLVTSYVSHIDANFMGVKFAFDYLASVKYTDIQVNDSITALVKKEEKMKQVKEKKNLEIKPYDERYKREADSLATQRDSMYWSEIRSITLNEEEIASYARKDTIQSKSDSIKNERSGANGYSLFNALVGGQVGRDSSKVIFRYGSLLKVAPEYNFVDGLWLGTSFGIDIKRKEHSFWEFKPSAYWALSRKRLLWTMDLNFTYAPLKLGKLKVSGGSCSEDYMGNNGMSRIENMYNSILWGINNAKFYQKDFFNAENDIEIIHGLKLKTGIEIADRKALENHASYSFRGNKKDVKPNIPPYSEDLNEQYDRLAKYEIGLQYIPELYYTIEKGKKRYVRTRFPTFFAIFRQGLAGGEPDYSKFHRLDLSIMQTVRLGLFNRLNYQVNAGKFFNKNEFNYIDYKHFNSSDQLFTKNEFETSFVLLPYYTYSTNKEWIQAMVNYRSDYLLLKRMPFLHGKPVKESLHGKFLHTPGKKFYSEWGYSLTFSALAGLGMSAGVFVGLDKFDYNSVGFRISFPLLDEF
ncbi:MAG: DUF5686 and carboxypeptidase regulatory-like domain-containing protein [Dysgonamonadaceae bacterium]|jgi:hypothetical protein|nr:DUF5686 and carboxypeptidase regulatory-like domain-containing protein [Dysgonamonadaceae bacterium]